MCVITEYQRLAVQSQSTFPKFIQFMNDLIDVMTLDERFIKYDIDLVKFAEAHFKSIHYFPEWNTTEQMKHCKVLIADMVHTTFVINKTFHSIHSLILLQSVQYCNKIINGKPIALALSRTV